MKRTVVSREQLYRLLESKFDEVRVLTGCPECSAPYPFYRDPIDGTTNWRVAAIPRCLKACELIFGKIVEEMSQRYEVPMPLWRAHRAANQRLSRPNAPAAKEAAQAVQKVATDTRQQDRADNYPQLAPSR